MRPPAAAPSQARRPRRRRVTATAVGLAGLVALAAAVGAPAWAQAPTSTTAKPTSTTRPVTTTARPTSTTARPSTTTQAPTTTTTSPPATEPETTEASALPWAGGAAPFPAGTVATVPYADVPAEQAMAAVYVTAGGDAKQAPFAVQFRKPFDLPSRQPYRLSVVFGDPVGPQVRASLTTNGGPTPTGTVEKRTGDGADWTFVETTDVTFDRSGLAAITYPIEIAPGGAAWVESQVGEGDIVQTPYWSPDALVGVAVAGRLPSAPIGQVIGGEGKVVDRPVGLPGPPELAVVNQSVALTLPAPAPTELAGHRVTSTVASIQVAPSYANAAAVSDEIRVDRTTGAINLISRAQQPPVDKTSEPGWLVQGLPEGDTGAPATVTFDLAQVLAGLGIDATAIDQTTGIGLGVRQEYVLDNGTIVVGAPTLGTTEWFAINGIVATTPTVPPAAPQGGLVADDGADATRWWLLAGAVAVVVLLAGLALLVRRRLAARDDAADVLQTLAHEAELARTGQVAAVATGSTPAVTGSTPAVTGSTPAVTGSTPVVTPRATPVVDATLAGPPGPPSAAEGAAPADAGGAPMPIVTVEDLQRAGDAGPSVEAPPVEAPPVEAPPVEAPQAPVEAAPAAADATSADPFAAFDAQMAELEARLRRLSGGAEGESPGGSGSTPAG